MNFVRHGEPGSTYLVDPPGGGWLTGTAQRITLSQGWRRVLIAIAAGGLGALAMPPYGLFPALVVSLSIAVWLLDGAAADARTRPTLARAALIGWAWGFGYLTAGLWWLGANLWLMQPAALVGLYGLTLASVLIAAAPALIATESNARARWLPTLVATLALVGLALSGAQRLSAPPEPVVEGVRLRLIQPNLPHDAAFRSEDREGIVSRYLALSDRATSPDRSGIADVTHLIWPESAFPFLLQRDPDALETIGAALPAGKQLITGAARAQEPLTREHRVFFNAILTIGGTGTFGDIYDKVHLVPFGEYLPGPFEALVRAVGLRQFVSVPGGFTPGSLESQRVLSVPGLPPVAATLCYEAIFPGAIVPSLRADAAPKVPGLILNLTDDAWFGDTPGPRQHFAQARLRAVEEGLPLVRDANSGITAVVDARGRVVASLPLGKEGVLDADLPAPLPGRTVYAQFGDLTFLALLVVTLLVAVAGRMTAHRAR